MVFFNDPVPRARPRARRRRSWRSRCASASASSPWAGGSAATSSGLGVGIAAGYATLGRIGFEGRYDYGAIGSVTNLAARLSDAGGTRADPPEPARLRGTRARIEAKPVAPLQMKGIARPEQAYELNAILDLH